MSSEFLRHTRMYSESFPMAICVYWMHLILMNPFDVTLNLFSLLLGFVNLFTKGQFDFGIEMISSDAHALEP